MGVESLGICCNILAIDLLNIPSCRLSIQSEIKELTDEVNRGVQALNSDGDVAKLEKEVNWFIG